MDRPIPYPWGPRPIPPIPEAQADEEPFTIPEVPGSKFDDEIPITIISRSGWRAKPAKKTTPMIYPITTVKFTWENLFKYDKHIATSLKMCQEYYQDKLELVDLPYNFLVDEGGLVFEGRGWTVASGFKGDRPDTLEIAFIGDHSGKFAVPSFDKMEAARMVIRQGVRQGILDINFKIIPMKKAQFYTAAERALFPTHDSDFVPIPREEYI